MNGTVLARSSGLRPACRTTRLALRLLAGLAAAALVFPAPSRAVPAGPVEIAVDTVWEGTVDVAGPVAVAPDATLLVMPGTTVRFSPPAAGGTEPRKAVLLVRGTLVAQGTADAPIVFTSAAAAPAPGDWRGILFEKANDRTSRLSRCRIEFADEGLAGAYSLLSADRVRLERNHVGIGVGRDFQVGIFDADIGGNGTGVVCNQGSGLTLESSRVAGNRNAGVVCLQGSSPRIAGSEIRDNGAAGVSCIQGSSPLVSGNLISGHARGVHVELKSRPRIERNEIVENGTGVWVEKLAFPLVAGNRIARNGRGVYCNYSGYPEIHGNDIVENTGPGIVLGDNQSIQVERRIPYRDQGRFFESGPEAEFLPPQTRKFTPFTASGEGLVDARGNWWGEAATAEMAALGPEGGNVSVIEDFFDKPDTFYLDTSYPRDRVVFAPWEAAPVPGAGRAAAAYSRIAGRVVHGGEPLAGARVHVYPAAAEAFRGEGATYSPPTGEDGAFELVLAPGTYFLAARKASPPFPHRDPGEGDLLGYYGGNPVTLGEGERREAGIQAVLRRPVVRERGAEGRAVLRGTVVGPAGPVEGAAVFVYADDSRHFRGPDLFGPQGAATGGSGPDGRFEAEVPPGRYFIVAASRRGGGTLGPLRAGDLHGVFDGNPVELADGETVDIAVQVVEKLRELEPERPARAGRTALAGKIRDPAGAIPPGVYAYATTDPNLMTGSMPPHRSAPVGPDGSYTIDLPAGGTYYVGARSGFGGPPLPGQWHGFHGGDAGPAPVDVPPDGVVGGVDITVRRME